MAHQPLFDALETDRFIAIKLNSMKAKALSFLIKDKCYPRKDHSSVWIKIKLGNEGLRSKLETTFTLKLM